MNKPEWRLETKEGFAAVFTPFGAALTAMYVPDRKGRFENIVYADPQAFGGAVIAPVAGRVRKGAVRIGGKQYTMPCDESEICLHSGPDTTAQKEWEVSAYTDETIVFQTYLPDGACGLPGNRNVTTEYSLRGNRLSLSIAIDTDCDTFVNPTSHIYWNLSADVSTAAQGHTLEIPSHTVYLNDAHHLPQRRCGTQHTPFDFSRPRMWEQLPSRDAQLESARGYNHAFVLEPSGALKLSHGQSGRTLTLTTNASHLVLYTGGFLPVPGCAVALEPQLVPDAPFLLGEQLPILKAGQTYQWKSQFEFGIAEPQTAGE